MLTLLGFTRQQINIRDFYPEIYGLTQDSFKEKFSNFNIELFINKIANRRFEIIKKLGIELRKYINRFKNNYKVNIITVESTFSNNQNQQVTNTYISDTANNSLDLIYIKYQKKIEQNIITQVAIDNKSNNNKSNNNIENNNNLHIFLKYINLINLYLPFENIKLDKNLSKFYESINYDVILNNDYISNITLNYIIDEIIRLINYNQNKNIKTNITQFIIEIIYSFFNSTFSEISKFNQEYNYFYQILYTSEFYLETQTNDYMMDAIDFYSSQEKNKDFDNLNDEQKNNIENEIDDDNEERDAIDAADDDQDIEGTYDLYSKEDIN